MVKLLYRLHYTTSSNAMQWYAEYNTNNTMQCNAIQCNAIQYWRLPDGISAKLGLANCLFFLVIILVNILPLWTSPKTGLLVIKAACLTAVSYFLFSVIIDSFVTNSGRNACDAVFWSFISSKCTSIRVRSLSTRPIPSILILPKGKVPVIY